MLQQDNDPKHTATVIKEFQSDYLNPPPNNPMSLYQRQKQVPNCVSKYNPFGRSLSAAPVRRM